MQKIYKDIKDAFPYLNLTDNDIAKVARSFKKDISPTELKRQLILYYKNKVLRDLNAGDYRHFNEYLQQFIVNTNIRECIKRLEVAMTTFTSVGLDLNPEIINFLISQNERFRNLLKAIVEELISKGLALQNVVQNELLQNIIEIYCITENISLENDEQVEDDIYDGLLVDSTRQYLKEIGRIPLLTLEEEQQLTQLYYDTRDENIKNRIVEANLRLVASIAKKYQNRGVPFLDLNIAGAFGLMKALDKFDPSKGYRLSTYATWDIRQAIQREIAKDNSIYMPVQLKRDIAKYIMKKNEISSMIGRDPSREDMAEYSDYTPDAIAEFEQLAIPVGSLHLTLGDKNDLKLEDLIASEASSDLEKVVLDEAVKEDLFETIKGMLNEKEIFVLEKRFGLVDGVCYTNDQIAHLIYEEGLSTNPLTNSRIRQIEADALRKLRYSKNAEKIAEFK